MSIFFLSRFSRFAIQSSLQYLAFLSLIKKSIPGGSFSHNALSCFHSFKLTMSLFQDKLMSNDNKGARLESKQILRAIKQRKSQWDQKSGCTFWKSLPKPALDTYLPSILSYCLKKFNSPIIHHCFASFPSCSGSVVDTQRVSHQHCYLMLCVPIVTYIILKVYNMKLTYDVGFQQIEIACCLPRLFFLTHGYKLT